MSYSIKVYYAGPVDPSREARLTDLILAQGGNLDFREENPSHSRAIRLTFDFKSLSKAQTVVEELRSIGERVEGPSDYGE